MNNRYLPSITLANDVLQEIITATELEMELKKHLINTIGKVIKKLQKSRWKCYSLQ
ncbi:hypothetical protein [Peribacillus frigoritolerans]|uniref:hypothetical protein n=1 Tax=Peribacillus frigoritolerans TaxID=450367 RepID=UPI00159BAE5B|nr:hypothetical protein [Peribacillus frigoritolerans]MCY9004439.1 hypothetical protein [Peribacillus frigoritolerans]